MHKALIISDMLNDFVQPGGALYVPGAEAIIPVILRLRDEAHKNGDLVIYACDAHAPDDGEFAFFPPHAVSGTKGAQIVAELAPTDVDLVLPKTTFDMFHRTGAGQALRNNRIRQAVVTGVCTHICVMEAVGGLFYRGIKPIVPIDAVADFDPEAAKAAIKRMQSVFGAEIVPAA